MLWRDISRYGLRQLWSRNKPIVSWSRSSGYTIEDPLCRVPATEEVMMRWPPLSLALKMGFAACASQRDCLTLKAYAVSQSASVNASTIRLFGEKQLPISLNGVGRLHPAFAMTRSRPPNFSCASLTRLRQSSRLLTSAWMATHPFGRTFSASCARDALLA